MYFVYDFSIINNNNNGDSKCRSNGKQQVLKKELSKNNCFLLYRVAIYLVKALGWELKFACRC